MYSFLKAFLVLMKSPGTIYKSNCIHFCSRNTLSSSRNVNVVEWLGPMPAV